MNRREHYRSELLVIGYGNSLRSDDGAGPRVAEAVAAKKISGTETISCHQLTPEFAERVSSARRVVFVDATSDLDSEGLQVRELRPAETGDLMAHAADPRTLLALARDVYGSCPQAWLLTIPIEDTGFGESVSARAQRGIEDAVVRIEAMAAPGGGAEPIQ